MLREQKCRAFVASSRFSHAVAAAPSFQACLCTYICTCWMCVCIYVYVCVCTNMHVCIYPSLHVYMYRYTHACIYMYVYACLCIDLSPSSHSSACLDSVIDAHVYFLCICLRMHMCVCICIRALFLLGVACALKQVCGHQCMCSCMRYTDVPLTSTYTYAKNSLQVVHICAYAYMCIRMPMYVDAYVRL